MDKTVNIDGNDIEVQIINQTANEIVFSFGGEVLKYSVRSASASKAIVQKDGELLRAHSFAADTKGSKQLFLNGAEVLVKVMPKARGAQSSVMLSEGSLQSPMPGNIFKILKVVGEKVKRGEAVLVVEAMKMEHSIKAVKDGIIKKIFFKEGDQVTGGVLLCEIE